MASNNGIQLEKDIVNRNFSNPDVVRIYHMMNEQGFDTSSSMIRIGKYSPKWCNKKTEPKTDIVTGCGKRLSVKLHGKVQLASIGLDASLFLFNVACRNLGLHLPQITKYNSQVNNMLNRQSMPFRIAGQESLSNWNGEVRPRITASLEEMLQEYPGLKRELVYLCLTGDNLFEDVQAQAQYMVTPKKLNIINSDYINEATSSTKLRFALKGRGRAKGTNIRQREAIIRFDLDMKNIP